LHGTCPSWSIEPLKLALAIAGAIALGRFHYNHTNKGGTHDSGVSRHRRWRIASNIPKLPALPLGAGETLTGLAQS